MLYELISEKIRITSDDTQGHITMTRTINPESSFRFGHASMSKIELTLFDLKFDVFNEDIILPLQFNDGTFMAIMAGNKVGLYSHTIVHDPVNLRLKYMKNGITQGYYTIISAEKINDTKIKLTAYDDMMLLNKIADSWYNSLVFPINVRSFIEKMCTNLSVDLAFESLVNASYLILPNFKVQDVTYREALSWALEVMGCYAMFDENAVLKIKTYASTGKTITTADTFSTKVSDMKTEKWQALWIKSRENDLGKYVGDIERNTYIIQNNPLFYTYMEDSLTAVAQNLFNKIKDFEYTPLEVTVDNRSLSPLIGEFVTVNARSGSHLCLITEQSETGMRTSYTSKGAKKPIVSANASVIKQLKGRINEIVLTLSEFSVTLTQLESSDNQLTESMSQLRQTVNEFNLQVSETVSEMSDDLSQVTIKEQSTGTINLKKDKVEFSFNQIGKQGNAQYGAVIDYMGLHSYSANNMGMSLQNGQVVIQNHGSFIGNMGFDTNSRGERGIGMRLGYGTQYFTVGKQMGSNSFEAMLMVFPNGIGQLKPNSCAIMGDIQVQGDIFYTGQLRKLPTTFSANNSAMPAVMSLNEDDSTTFEAIEIPISYDPFMIPTGGE